MVNLLMLSDYITAPLTGVGRYSFEIAARMNALKEDVNLHFSSYRGVEFWEDIQSRANASVAEYGIGDKLSLRLVDTMIGSKCFEMLQLASQRRLLRRIGKNAVVHAPSIQALATRTSSPVVRVLTVHDLSHVVDSTWHPKRRVSRIEHALKDIQSVDRIIAVSAYTKSMLVQQFKLEPHRVTIISNGISDTFANIYVGRSKRSHSICVSTFEPRKNIDTLISAYSSLPQSLRLAYPLVLVGSSGWKSEAMRMRVRSFQAEGWLRYFGYVDALTLRRLYADAKLCVYPSRYEGFGLPVLEGLAAGCRVISGNHSSIPEVAGGHARLLADVTDVDEMRAEIIAALSPEWQSGEEVARVAYARTFTWDAAARRTLDIYREATATR